MTVDEDKLYSNDVEKDKIISQNPGKGRKVKEGREIKVVISLGPEMIEVPNLTNIEFKDAINRLGAAGLNPGDKKEENNDKYPEGVVITQDPAYGQRVKTGSTVNLVVSKGEETKQSCYAGFNGYKRWKRLVKYWKIINS